MGLFDILKGLVDPRETFKQFESGFGRLFPGTPESEELTPNLDELREFLSQLGDSDFVRNQVAQIMDRLVQTPTDRLQSVRAAGGSALQANEQFEADRTQRNQFSQDLISRLINEGKQAQAQGLFGVAGLEQQGLLGAAEFGQDRTDSIQSFINSILSGGAGVAGAAVGGSGVSGRTQTSPSPNFGLSLAQGFGNSNQLVSPAERLGGNFGGTQSLGQLPSLFT